ncbi:MAG TPA: aldehyde dehydrogenase family protein, partial [Acidimicrobiales bacterium]|nr:aldehyde dehydrogenase family protein [Acidimicrobiales bacterium]
MTGTTEPQSPTLRTKAFIDGDFCEAWSGEQFVSINPATGKALAEIASCGSHDVDRAVSAARRAFEDGRWSRRSPEQRKETLLRFAECLEENAEEIARLDAIDAGKPITDCRMI